MLFLLAGLLLAGCFGLEPEAGPSGKWPFRLHQSGLFQLKCESMLYRSIAMDGSCYFAIDKQISFLDGPSQCDKVFRGATFHTASDVSSLMNLLLLNSADYHGQTLTGSEKGALCKFENPFTCSSDERGDDLPGRCMHRMRGWKSYKEGFVYCLKRGATLPYMSNADENRVITAFSASSNNVSQSTVEHFDFVPTMINSYWTIFSIFLNWFRTSAQLTSSSDLPRVSYLNWNFAAKPQCGAGTVPSKNMVNSRAVAVSTEKIGHCAAYSTWEMTRQHESRAVVCVRSADSDFNPPSNGTRPAAAAAKPALYIPPIQKPTIPAPKAVNGKNGPPITAWMWTLRHYLNVFRSLHGFCADPSGCNQMNLNGIGYDGGAGVIGKTISDAGMSKMSEICSENHSKLKPLYFELNGVGYRHNFDQHGIFVGWVAVAAGHCGANIPINVWNCSKSADIMYAEDMDYNLWYRGRAWSGGPRFWLWR